MVLETPKPPLLIVVAGVPNGEEDVAWPKVDGCPNMEEVVEEVAIFCCNDCPNIDAVVVTAEDSAVGCDGCPNIEVEEAADEVIGWAGCPNIDVADEAVGCNGCPNRFVVPVTAVDVAILD